MSIKLNKITTKRFVIRKSLIGTNTIITFVTKKGKSVTYNHDEVYNRNKDRFESMKCFQKYKSYTNTNNIPTFCRQINLHTMNTLVVRKVDSLGFYGNM